MVTRTLPGAAAAPSPAPVRAASSTFQRIRDLIVFGKLAPGSRLIEAELAARLGVSRTPVREALYRLQQDGYVIVTSTQGKSRMAVAPLTNSDARELYRIVGHLEGLAARRAAELPTLERRRLTDRLAEINHALVALQASPNHAAGGFVELDMDFHQAIVDADAGPRLRAICAAVKPQVERYWRLYASVMSDDLGASVEEHNEIIAGLIAGDPDAAEHWVRHNWDHGAMRLGRIISTHGEHGHW